MNRAPPREEGASSSTTSPPVYRALRLSVRPPRVAALIPDDELWESSVLHMVENFNNTLDEAPLKKPNIHDQKKNIKKMLDGYGKIVGSQIGKEGDKPKGVA